MWFAALALAVAMQPAPADAPAARAEWLFLNRHLGTGYADSALAFIAGESDEEALALRARIYCQLGEDAEDRAECAHLCMLARATADTLRRLNDNNAAGHLWWASSQGRLAEMQGILHAAAVASEVRRELERAGELDSGFAYARYALGRMLLEMPGMLGGSVSGAEAGFRAALAADPGLTIARLDLARVLDRQRNRAAAIAELDTLLATEDPSHPAEYFRHDRPQAQALLNALRER